MADSRLRVLVVINSLGLAGAERMLERVVTTLSRDGRVDYTVCSLEREGPIGADLRARGVMVVALESGRGVRGLWRAVRGVRALLRNGTFDVIHSYLYRSNCVAALARMGLRRFVPLIFSVRCLGDNRSWAVTRARKLLGGLADRTETVAEAVRRRVIEHDGVRPERVVVVRSGIDPVDPDPAAGTRLRRILGIRAEEVVFLMLGRLHHEKGPDLLLEALGILSSAGITHWRALCVGTGPELEACRRRARALGIEDGVMFAGARRRVDAWIEACDVLVLPSRTEGLPVAALEAMARAKPVVATRVGGTAEAVRDGRSGILVPPEDPRALAAALGALAWDASARAALGGQGFDIVRGEFSIDRMAGETLDLYEDVIRHPVPRAERARGEALLGVRGK